MIRPFQDPSPQTIRLLLLAIAALTTGCGEASPPPNLLLISIDTLRADHLGCYGYMRPTSPFLDRLASQGVLFEQAHTTAPWTLPSHVSMFTGLYPSQHGVMTEDHALPAEVPTLAEVLRGRGFSTAGFVSGIYLRPRFGLARGFDHYLVVPTRAKDGDSGTSLDSTDRVSEAGLEWLVKQPKRPFFLFLHYFDVHSDYRPDPRFAALFGKPYQGPVDGTSRQLRAVARGKIRLDAEDRARLVDLYDAEIRQFDQALEAIFARLDERGELERTIVAVTSDHGEEFFDHGGVLHGRTHYQELMRVPLILVGPGIPRNLRVGAPVSLVDLVPTLLMLTGVETGPAVSGQDLGPLWTVADDDGGERSVFAEANRTFEGISPQRVVRRGRWKLVLHGNGKRELFDLVADPGERVNRADAEPERTAELAALLTANLGSAREAPVLPPLEPAMRRELEALGYVRD
jgi:arylsulfatase A-like enzyme